MGRFFSACPEKEICLHISRKSKCTFWKKDTCFWLFSKWLFYKRVRDQKRLWHLAAQRWLLLVPLMFGLGPFLSKGDKADDQEDFPSETQNRHLVIDSKVYESEQFRVVQYSALYLIVIWALAMCSLINVVTITR